MGKTKSAADANQLRAAFQSFMDQYGVKPTDVARRSGLSNANAIYNFMNARSSYLGNKTLAAIADAFPGVSIDRLSGREAAPPRQASPQPSGNKRHDADPSRGISGRLFVMMEVVGGEWRDSVQFKGDEMYNLPMPVANPIHFAGAFGVIVRGPGAELLFPPGTVLVCLIPKAAAPALTDGAIVILQCVKNGKTQLSIRQIERRGEDVWLCTRSTQVAHQSPVQLPRLDEIDATWSAGGVERYKLYAVVAGAYMEFFSRAA